MTSARSARRSPRRPMFIPTKTPRSSRTSPATGPNCGGHLRGTSLGTDFTGVTAVYFGSTPAGYFFLQGSTDIEARKAPPASAGNGGHPGDDAGRHLGDHVERSFPLQPGADRQLHQSGKGGRRPAAPGDHPWIEPERRHGRQVRQRVGLVHGRQQHRDHGQKPGRHAGERGGHHRDNAARQLVQRIRPNVVHVPGEADRDERQPKFGFGRRRHNGLLSTARICKAPPASNSAAWRSSSFGISPDDPDQIYAICPPSASALDTVDVTVTTASGTSDDSCGRPGHLCGGHRPSRA